MPVRELTDLEDELHHAAVRIAGFADFGPQNYREGLRVLLKAFDTDLRLTEVGSHIAYKMILHHLTARLYAERGWVEHPHVLAHPIERPLVILGLPRTGTTALHRLLSVDPQFQGIETWLRDAPMIRPPREKWKAHPEYHTCAAYIDELHALAPDLRKAHYSAAEDLEECTGVLMQSFESTAWSASRLPTHSRWLLGQNAATTYHHYANVLRLIGAQEPQRRWLLKSPYHLVGIESLLEVFPDACIVHTHRDPLKAIPSYCSLVHMFGRVLEGETAKPEMLGPRLAAYWREALGSTAVMCRRLPKQFFHVDHRRFLGDPLGTVRSVYEYFGLALSPATEERMRAWIAASPTTAHGEHRYSIDSWGLSATQICEAFSEYRKRHQFDHRI